MHTRQTLLFLSEDEVLPCEAQQFDVEIGAADFVLLALVTFAWQFPIFRYTIISS
jgi:hypothetical protein